MPIFNGEVNVAVDFYFKQPLTHFKHNIRSPEELRPSRVNNACVGACDVDNLLKFVLDSMQSVLYRNDRQVVSVRAQKLYCDNEDERINIFCHPVDNDVSMAV
jgi:Holliday junction resolvase RusA-like endonuclease